jgi:replication factor A1
VASGDDKSVEMIFFGYLARDLVGKPADVLVAENNGFLGTVPAEIDALIGRSYVIDVIVSQYSFCIKDISFQVSKFYPEGSSVFALACWAIRHAECCQRYDWIADILVVALLFSAISIP